jgi:hypothetical protein
MSGKLEVATMLIGRGADPEAKDKVSDRDGMRVRRMFGVMHTKQYTCVCSNMWNDGVLHLPRHAHAHMCNSIKGMDGWVCVMI